MVKFMICIIWVIRWQIIFTASEEIVFRIWASESDITQSFNSGMPLCRSPTSKKTCFCAFGLVNLLNMVWHCIMKAIFSAS